MVTNMCVKFGEDWTNSFQELDRKQSSGRTYGQGQPYMPPLCGAIKNKEGYSINFIKDKFNSMLKNKEGYSINFIKDKFNSMLKTKVLVGQGQVASTFCLVVIDYVLFV